MKILVTGGCGFIGSNFINYHSEKYPNDVIVNIDRIDYCASEDNVKPTKNYKFVHGDINDKDLVYNILVKYSIDTIVHFAAQSHVDNSFEKSVQFTIDNILGTHNILEAARIYGKILRFIHMSTDEVYGQVNMDHVGCTEKSKLNPTNPYAATKVGAEAIVSSYYYCFGLPIIICRGNNVYGPNQYREKLIPKFVHHIKNGEKCPVHGNGQTRRNFIHAYDMCTGIDTILSKGRVNTVYNIGTDNEYSVLEITQMILDILKPGEGIDKWVEFVDDRKFNDFRYSIDASVLRKLGWTDSIQFKQGLSTLISCTVKSYSI
jgi:dTDP-glucose 4,6-dehydratase